MAESQPTQTGNPAAGGDSNVEPAAPVQANIQGNVAHVPPIDHPPLVPGPGEEQRGDEKPERTLKELYTAQMRQHQADRSRKSEPKKQEPKSQELLTAEAATRADYAKAGRKQIPKGMGGMGRHE